MMTCVTSSYGSGKEDERRGVGVYVKREGFGEGSEACWVRDRTGRAVLRASDGDRR